MPRLQGRIDDDGAVIKLSIAIDDDEADILRVQGRQVPEPYQTTGLIDIGASRTAVAPEVIDYLKSQRSGFAKLVVVGDEETQTEIVLPLYDLRVTLGFEQPSFDIQAVAARPATPGVSVLIGRGILDECRLVYDGQKGRFRLWF